MVVPAGVSQYAFSQLVCQSSGPCAGSSDASTQPHQPALRMYMS